MSLSSVTIVGAGLAGLATAEAALQEGLSVTLLEAKKPGAGASGAATGLLHPFPGLRALVPWQGIPAFLSAAEHLERYAQQDPKILFTRGVWRPALPSQEQDYRRAAERAEADGRVLAQWREDGPPATLPQGLVCGAGLWIPQGFVVDVPRYLHFWSEDLRKRGVQFVQRSWEEGLTPGITILATGPAIGKRLGCELVRGQSLCVQPPPGTTLPCGIAGRAYLAPEAQGWWVGGTFEHGDDREQPEPKEAVRLLLPRVVEMWPGEHHPLTWPILAARAGLRVSAPGHLPVIGHWQGNLWVYTGLGSKGLLYHLWGAKLLMRSIVHGEPLPVEVGMERLVGRV